MKQGILSFVTWWCFFSVITKGQKAQELYLQRPFKVGCLLPTAVFKLFISANIDLCITWESHRRGDVINIHEIEAICFIPKYLAWTVHLIMTDKTLIYSSDFMDSTNAVAASEQSVMGIFIVSGLSKESRKAFNVKADWNFLCSDSLDTWSSLFTCPLASCASRPSFKYWRPDFFATVGMGTPQQTLRRLGHAALC